MESSHGPGPTGGIELTLAAPRSDENNDLQPHMKNGENKYNFKVHKDTKNDVQMTVICDNLSFIEPVFDSPAQNLKHERLAAAAASGAGNGSGGPNAEQFPGDNDPEVFTNPIIAPLADLFYGFRYYALGQELCKRNFYRIRDFDAVISPGTTTIILGAPGCGRGTVLRALSGISKEPSQGGIYYNGLTLNEADVLEKCDVKKMLRFVDQTSCHFEMLTVRELLDFAYKVSIDVEAEYNVDYVDNIIRAFDMIEAANTQFRNLSGGQQRRVSVMSGLTNPHTKVLCLKNPTDGLDSAVAERVVLYLKQWAQVNNAAVVIAMQQPSPTVFFSFDNLIVLKEGDTVYYGPTSEVEQFFSAMGFPAPDDAELSTHILNVLQFPKMVLQEHVLAQRVAKEKKKKKANKANKNGAGGPSSSSSSATTGGGEKEDGDDEEDADANDDGFVAAPTLQVPIMLAQHSVLNSPASPRAGTGGTGAEGGAGALGLALDVNSHNTNNHSITSDPMSPTSPNIYSSLDPTQVILHNVHTTPVVTTHGLLIPSICPCVTKEEMIQFYRSSPQYRFVRDMIAETHRLRSAKQLEDFSEDPAVVEEEEAEGVGDMGGHNGGRSSGDGGSSGHHDFIILHHKKQLSLLQYDNAKNPALAYPMSPKVLEYMNNNNNKADGAGEVHNNAVGLNQNDQQQQHAPLITFGPLITPETQTFYTRGYSTNFFQLLSLVLSREFSMTIRNKAYMATRMIPVAVQSALFGGLYWQLPLDNYSSRIGYMGDITTELSFNNLISSAMVIYSKQILHAELGSYPLWIYTLAVQLCAIPFAMIESLVLSAVTYFLVGNTPRADLYILFWLMLTIHAIAITGFFRLVGTMSKNASYAYAFLGVAVVILYECNGYYVRPSTIPTWLCWLPYISPFAWALRAMANVEFSAPRYDYMVAGANGVLHRAGDFYLELNDVLVGMEWLGYSVVYCVGLIVVFVLLQAFFLNDPQKEYTMGTQRFHVTDASDGIAVVYSVDEQHHFVEQMSDQNINDNLNNNNNNTNNHNAAYEPSITKQNNNNNAHGNANNQPEVSRYACGNQKLNALTNKLTFTPSTLSWENISMTVNAVDEVTGKPYKRRLLNNVSGYAQVGTSTACLGSSGAGKTTMMGCLYGTNITTSDIEVTGTFRVNGKAMSPKDYAPFTGFVEQFSSLPANETVYETLFFSAKMKLVGVAEDVLREVVDEVLDVLDLTPVQHTLCGSPEAPSLSPSQMKRVSIGVVLVANPAILLFDEPTTGLSTQESITVVRAISRIARSGRACITTIHQPDASLFYNFDSLLLLGSGGFTIFFGRMGFHAKRVVEYFESFDASLIQKWQTGTNVAEWMVDQISADVGGVALLEQFGPEYAKFYDENTQYSPPVVLSSKAWKNVNKENNDNDSDANNKAVVAASSSSSRVYTHFEDLSARQRFIQYLYIAYMKSAAWSQAQTVLKKLVPQVEFDQSSLPTIASQHNQEQQQDHTALTDTNNQKEEEQHEHKYIPLFQQLHHVTARTWHIYTRDSGLFYPRMTIFVCLGFFFALIFMNIKVTSLNSLITFFASTTLSSANILFAGISLTVLPVYNSNRAVFYKEQQKKLYRPALFPISFILCEAAVILPLSLLGFVIYYFSINGVATAKAFFAYWLSNYILGFCFACWTLCLSLTLPRYSFSELINNISAAVFFAFAGISMRVPEMNPVFRFLARLMPIYYVNRMISIVQFEDATDTMVEVVWNDVPQVMTVRELAEMYLGYDQNQYWWSALWIAVIFLSFISTAVFSATFFRWKSEF